MSLVTFKAGNHPQQTGKGQGDPEKDERYTPRALISALHLEHRFTVDAAGCAAAPASQLIGRWWDRNADGLAQDWSGERVWCNPPYSDLAPWVRKAWASRGLVVMLLPANRTEQGWWQEHIEPHRDNGGRLRTRFLPSRVKFGNPEDPEALEPNNRPPFGCVLLMWTDEERAAHVPPPRRSTR